MTNKERDDVLDTLAGQFLGTRSIELQTSRRIYQAVERICDKHVEKKDESTR